MIRPFELSAIDRHFADFICRVTGEPVPWLKLAASLASNAVGNGHICLNLADMAGRAIRINGDEITLPEMCELKQLLEETKVIGKPGDFRPLVLDDLGRLYLYRYWKYERDLAAVILGKSAALFE